MEMSMDAGREAIRPPVEHPAKPLTLRERLEYFTQEVKDDPLVGGFATLGGAALAAAVVVGAKIFAKAN